MCGFYCVAFLKYMLAGKILLGYTNLFSSDDYKDTMVKEVSLEFRLRKIDETRNCFLDEVKNNDLMSGKYKKTYKYLNYV